MYIYKQMGIYMYIYICARPVGGCHRATLFGVLLQDPNSGRIGVWVSLVHLSPYFFVRIFPRLHLYAYMYIHT